MSASKVEVSNIPALDSSWVVTKMSVDRTLVSGTDWYSVVRIERSSMEDVADVSAFRGQKLNSRISLQIRKSGDEIDFVPELHGGLFMT